MATYKTSPDSFTCHHCGGRFTGRKRKYCGEECSAKAKNQRKVSSRARVQPFRRIRRPNPIINGMRECLDCGQTLPLSAYPVKADSKCKGGQTIRGVCKSCEKADRRKRGAKRTPEQRQLERQRAAIKAGRKYGPKRIETEAIRKADQLAKQNAMQAWNWWLTQAPDDWIIAYYDALGKPWSNPRLSNTEKYKVRYTTDPLFAIKERIRRQVTKAAKRDGVADLIRSALRRGGQSPMAEKLLGYSIDDLRVHLERQFTKGMDWSRFMSGEIHIDHIIPQSLFDMRDEDQWRKCWCLSNLRPLWGKENLRKRDRVLHLL